MQWGVGVINVVGCRSYQCSEGVGVINAVRGVGVINVVGCRSYQCSGV